MNKFVSFLYVSVLRRANPPPQKKPVPMAFCKLKFIYSIKSFTFSDTAVFESSKVLE